MTKSTRVSQRKDASLTVVFRRLAASLRAGKSADEALAGIRQAVSLLPGLENVGFSAGDGPVEFKSDALTIPLVGADGTLGAMSVSPGAGEAFHSGQLQMAGAVADAVSAMIEQYNAARSGVSVGRFLEIALNELPIGIICFESGGGQFFANNRATAFLSADVPTSWDSVWEQLAPERCKEVGKSFVRSKGLHLLYCAARQATDGGPRAIVITDLAPQAAAFSDGLALDIMRAGENAEVMSLAVIAAPEGSPEPIELAESLFTHLPNGARAGPIEAESAGVFVPGVTSGSLLALLREHCRAQGLRSVRLGVASYQPGKDTPERLLARATVRLQGVDDEARPEIFVADRSVSVADSLAVALRRNCRVTVSPPDESGLDLLTEHPFDGLFLELPDSDTEWVNRWVMKALDLQPAARPFFVTDVPGPWDFGRLGLPEAPVFRKPFVVREVREALEKTLAPGE